MSQRHTCMISTAAPSITRYKYLMGKWEVNLANTEKSGVYHSSECFPIIYICFIRFLITNDKCTIDLLQDYVTTEYAAEQNKLYTPNMFESGIFPPLPYLRLKLEWFLFSLKCICFISLRLLKKNEYTKSISSFSCTTILIDIFVFIYAIEKIENIQL